MRVKTRIRIIFICIALLIIGILLLIRFNLTKVLISVSEASIRSITTVAVNDAIYYTLNDELRYEDLVQIERGKEGEILAITADATKINRIARDTAYLSQSNLDKLSANGVEIPLGAFTGIEALAGAGPKLNIKIIPISNVACSFSSTFKSVGINQVLHSIYLEITADISLILPSGTRQIASTTQVLISESMLTGKVPDVYLEGDIF